MSTILRDDDAQGLKRRRRRGAPDESEDGALATDRGSDGDTSNGFGAERNAPPAAATDRPTEQGSCPCVCVWRTTCLLAHTYSMQALPDAEDEEEEGEEEEDVVEVPAPKVARTK